MQIRSKLTIQFLLIVAGILFVALLFIHFQFEYQLKNEFYTHLQSKALMTAQMVLSRTEIPDNKSSSQIYYSPTSYSENISIYSKDLQRIYSFNPVNDQYLSATLKTLWEKEESRFIRGKFHVLATLFTRNDQTPFLIIIESVFNPEQLQNLDKILIWVFGTFIVLVALSGWVFAGQALKPLNKIMNQVDKIFPKDLSQRLEPPNQKDELSRLVITFNKLLDRIQHAFKNQKSFLSNVSHELKNPLNVIISQLEITLHKDRTGQEYRETMKSVLEDVRDLSEISEKLFQLAKTNSDENIIPFQKIRIDEIIWQTKESILKTNKEYQIKFEIANLPEDEEKLFINGNEKLLKIALLNLLENGCKFSHLKQVIIRLNFVEKNAISIEIEDHGPGIKAEEIPLLFQPFYRSPSTSFIKGKGIGLSLVDNIMKLHRIKMKVTSRIGQGTTFSLEFPVT